MRMTCTAVAVIVALTISGCSSTPEADVTAVDETPLPVETTTIAPVTTNTASPVTSESASSAPDTESDIQLTVEPNPTPASTEAVLLAKEVLSWVPASELEDFDFKIDFYDVGRSATWWAPYAEDLPPELASLSGRSAGYPVIFFAAQDVFGFNRLDDRLRTAFGFDVEETHIALHFGPLSRSADVAFGDFDRREIENAILVEPHYSDRLTTETFGDNEYWQWGEDLNREAFNTPGRPTGVRGQLLLDGDIAVRTNWTEQLLEIIEAKTSGSSLAADPNAVDLVARLIDERFLTAEVRNQVVEQSRSVFVPVESTGTGSVIQAPYSNAETGTRSQIKSSQKGKLQRWCRIAT